jgi:hypothetical protein
MFLQPLLLTAAVAGLVYYSNRKGPIRGEMCNQGMCETMTMRIATPTEQQIILDPPVETALRDDRYLVPDCTSDAILRIRKRLQIMQEQDADSDPGVALGAPAVI